MISMFTANSVLSIGFPRKIPSCELTGHSRLSRDRCCVTEVQQVASKPSPAPVGIGLQKSPRSGDPRGVPRPRVLPRGSPTSGTRGAPTFPTCFLDSQHTCTYLNYGTTLIHSYVKLFYTACSVTSTCNISFLMVTILHHCTPHVQHLPSPFCGL